MLEGHVCRDLKDDVGNEEDGQGNIVLVPLHAQILFKLDESGVADVSSIIIRH